MTGRYIEVVPTKTPQEFKRVTEVYGLTPAQKPATETPALKMGEAVGTLLEKNIQASLVNARLFHLTPMILQKGQIANPDFVKWYQNAEAFDGMVYAIAERHPEETKKIIGLIKEAAKIHTKTTDEKLNKHIARHASKMIQRVKSRNFPKLEK